MDILIQSLDGDGRVRTESSWEGLGEDVREAHAVRLGEVTWLPATRDWLNLFILRCTDPGGPLWIRGTATVEDLFHSVTRSLGHRLQERDKQALSRAMADLVEKGEPP